LVKRRYETGMVFHREEMNKEVGVPSFGNLRTKGSLYSVVRR
jgi:hypothetical protein